jgi:pimeloyl-ACP methyl ester carboxylesterase
MDEVWKMIRMRWLTVACAALLLTAAGYAEQAPATQPAEQAEAWVLHLPGVGGKRSIDRNLVRGLQLGGLRGQFQIYDWCGEAPGMSALWSRQTHQRESALVAQMIERQFRAEPHRPIILTCHSGGTGIAAWALEQLPEDVIVQQVLMLAPALSPQYDLSRALQRVAGQAYVFSSVYDTFVLGAGTRMMGTIDGIQSDAAGLIGFAAPASADVEQYRKLVSCAYRQAWLRHDNAGEHIGPMAPRFAQFILAPLLRTGAIPDEADDQ